MVTDEKRRRFNHIEYRCSVCQQPKRRDELIAKRVQYTTIKPIKVIRSRVTGWLCEDCLKQDPPYNSPAHQASPGWIEQTKEM